MKKTNLFLTGIIFTTLIIQLLIHKAQAQVCFSPGVNFGVGVQPHSVISADYNNDSKADLVVANRTSNNVSVLLGNGMGGFDSPVNYTVGAGPVSVFSADFNLDGKADLVVANGGSNNVSILLGDGLGSFGTVTTFTVGSNPYKLISNDFNGDGKGDLAVTNSGSNDVSILLGDGLGSFGAATNIAIGPYRNSIISADFNGDNKVDLGMANGGSSNTVSVLLGDGFGSFGSETTFAVGISPQSIISQDFNEDGKSDLAIVNYGSNNLSVLIGDGLGNFGSATNFAVGIGPQSIINGDFNGDGKTDLTITNSDGNNVSVLLGDGAGGFNTATNFTVGNRPVSVNNGDFNGDGKTDLVVANYLSNNISVLLNTLPFVTAQATATTVCAGASITLTGVGASSYTWTEGVVDGMAFSAPEFNITYTVTGTTAGCSNTATKTITVNPLPVSNAGNDLTICTGLVGDIGASAIVGNTYSWSPSTGLTDTTVSNPANTTINSTSTPIVTTYTVTTTITATGCKSTDTSVIIINPQPLLAITNPSAVCFPNKVDITAGAITIGSTGGGILSYWTDAGATSSLSSPNVIATSGTNYIKVIATGGCTDIKPVTDTVNPLPISNAGNDLTICSGIVGDIGASAIAGNTYSWTPSTGLTDTTVSNPANTTINSTSTPIVTIYTVTTSITATGCQSSDSSVIIINPQPVLAITNPSAACFPNTVDITAGAVTIGSTGGGALSYWNDAGATSSLSSPNAIATSGTNYIKVTANGGCTDIKPVTDTVNSLPISNAGNDLTICSGIVGDIGASAIVGNTYSWSPSTGLTDTTVSNPANTTINSTSTPIVTTYTVTTTITATGCQSTDNSVITVNPQPALAITSPAAVCFPHTVNITASAVTIGSTGGGTISYWNDAGATSSLSSPNAIAASGTKYIKVTATGGCTDIKPVTDTVNPQPVATFISQDESSSLYCDGSIKASLTGGTGTIQSQWLDFAQTVLSTADSVSALCPGTITLNLSDAISCMNSYTLVIQPGPIPPTPQVCLVTVDSTFTHNLIVWEKTNLNMIGIDSFVVYREIGTNTYHAIGTVFHDSLSTFDDLGANPATTGYRYKLKSKNAHGVLSLFSDFHNTIYLTNTGGNFSWTPYQVENITTPVFTYNVYRDDNSTGNFQPIGNTTGNQFGYTDINFSSFPFASYYVEAVMTSGVCNPTRSSFTAARSNVKHFGTTEVQQFSINTAIKIYPNPAGNILNITGITGKTIVHLYDVVGKLVIEKEVENNCIINTNQLANGIYSLLMESKTVRTFNKVVISH